MLWQRTFSSVFRAVLLHSETAQFNLECMEPLRQSEFLEKREILSSVKNSNQEPPDPVGQKFQNSNKYLKIIDAKRGDIERVLYQGPTV